VDTYELPDYLGPVYSQEAPLLDRYREPSSSSIVSPGSSRTFPGPGTASHVLSGDGGPPSVPPGSGSGRSSGRASGRSHGRGGGSSRGRGCAHSHGRCRGVAKAPRRGT
jgi:hypothetical protein